MLADSEVGPTMMAKGVLSTGHHYLFYAAIHDPACDRPRLFSLGRKHVNVLALGNLNSGLKSGQAVNREEVQSVLGALVGFMSNNDIRAICRSDSK